MRFLIVGAGALGGYFGGRLLAAGRDVTFLVRQRRAAELEAGGLVVESPRGNLRLPPPPHRLAAELQPDYDVVVVACKAYDLEQTMESFAGAVGPGTAILPLLNGMSHLERLAARFGEAAVLGGLCMISAVLGPGGIVLHLNEAHTLVYGERDGSRSARVEAIAADFADAGFDARLSTEIVQAMWEKWVTIASVAGINCLIRATLGEIVAVGAADLATALLDECAAIAARQGHAPRERALMQIRGMLTTPGSTMTASMLKDLERGAPIEAEAIIGDLLALAEPAVRQRSLLRIVDAQLRAYELRRASSA